MGMQAFAIRVQQNALRLAAETNISVSYLATLRNGFNISLTETFRLVVVLYIL